MADQLILRILHLSDLHAGQERSWWTSGTRDETECKRPPIGRSIHELLLAHLHDHYGEQFGLIAVTGDLTHHGARSEFGTVATLLNDLRQGLACTYSNLGRPYMCIVPGNHDVAWRALKQIDDDGQWNRYDEEGLYDLKFKEFLHAVRDPRLSNRDPGQRNCDSEIFSFERQFALVSHKPHTKDSNDKPWTAFGLNTAVRNTHRTEDHHGEFSPQQMKFINQQCCGFSPWEFRLALLHHEPILMPYEADPKLDVIDPARAIIEEALEGDNKKELRERACKPLDELKRLGNYLRNTRTVLQDLAEIGTQLALVGHYHFAEAQHYVFPQPPEKANPFGHGGITVLRGGAFNSTTTPAFQVIEVYQGNFRFKLRVYSHRVLLSDGNLVGEGFEKGRYPYECSCQSGRTNSMVDGIIRILTKACKKRDNSGAGKVDNLYCGTKLDVAPAQIRLCPPHGEEHHPMDHPVQIDDWDLAQLNQDVQSVLWYRLCTDLLENAALYADLPHWSLVGIRSLGSEHPEYTCEFGISRYMHYLLLNLGLRERILAKAGGGTESFREKYLLVPEHSNSFRERSVKTVDAYLRLHRFMGLRTTLQVIFYVDHWDSDSKGAVFLKMRSNEVGHFKGQIQLPVGGGFKSVLFGERGMRNLQQAIQEETGLETGVTLKISRCIGLTVNTRTFCPAFTFLLCLRKNEFTGFFRFDGEKKVFKDEHEREFVRVDSWVPIPQEGRGFPRDWWEGAFLVPVGLSERPNCEGGPFYTLLLRSIQDFFVSKSLLHKLDEYVGSCIDLYCTK